MYLRNRKGVVTVDVVCKDCNAARRKRYWHEKHELNKARNRANHARRKAAGKVKPWFEQRWVRQIRAFVDWLKKNPCADCSKVFHPVAMDFDHVRGTKLFNIGMIRSTQCKGVTQEEVWEEIQKCELVCSNCHRVRTYNRRHTLRLVV